MRCFGWVMVLGLVWAGVGCGSESAESAETPATAETPSGEATEPASEREAPAADEAPAAPSAEEQAAEEEEAVELPDTPPINLTDLGSQVFSGAYRIAVSSSYRGESWQGYHLVDGSTSTAWNSASGDLEGAWIAALLPREYFVTSLAMTVGFTHQRRGRDLFTSNHRIRKVRVTRGDELIVEHEFDVDERGLQHIPINRRGGMFRVLVTELVPGTREDWREVCVSEFQVMGHILARPSDFDRNLVPESAGCPDCEEPEWMRTGVSTTSTDTPETPSGEDEAPPDPTALPARDIYDGPHETPLPPDDGSPVELRAPAEGQLGFTLRGANACIDEARCLRPHRFPGISEDGRRIAVITPTPAWIIDSSYRIGWRQTFQILDTSSFEPEVTLPLVTTEDLQVPTHFALLSDCCPFDGHNCDMYLCERDGSEYPSLARSHKRDLVRRVERVMPALQASPWTPLRRLPYAERESPPPPTRGLVYLEEFDGHGTILLRVYRVDQEDAPPLYQSRVDLEEAWDEVGRVEAYLDRERRRVYFLVVTLKEGNTLDFEVHWRVATMRQPSPS